MIVMVDNYKFKIKQINNQFIIYSNQCRQKSFKSQVKAIDYILKNFNKEG